MASQFVAELDQIFTGSQGGYVNRWSACNFFDKVVFAQGSISPLYWPGGGDARPVPGLPSGVGYDGVEAIAGHLVFWKDELVKWGDINDFTNFIPVAETAVSLRVTTTTSFGHPGLDQISEWVHVDESLQSFVKGQYVRAELDVDDSTAASYHFYQVEEVAPAGITGDSIAVSQSIAANSAGANIYTQSGAAWKAGSRLIVDDKPTELEVLDDSRTLTGFFVSSAQSEAVPLPDGTFHIQIEDNPSTLKVGDVLSIGRISATGLDLYEIVTVAFNLELRRLNIGTEKQANGFRFPIGTYLTFQPMIRVTSGSRAVNIRASSELSCALAVKLRGLGLTGERAVGSTVPIETDIQSLDANEAGETINAGSNINGSVFAVVSLGEYGVILKERSIQSMQYVGRQSGTFFIRSEILDEGPISRNAFCRMGDKDICFFGHKEIYRYSGGQVVFPVATQHSNEVYEELDRSRRDELVLYHNEKANEVWVVYPALGTPDLKVLIYNYRFNTSVIDVYDAALGGISAVGGVDWELAPVWKELLDSQIWDTETKKWYEYVEDGLQRYTIIAVGGDVAVPALGEAAGTVPRLLLHGRKYSRTSGDNCDEKSYYCAAETQDFDFKDSVAFKYVDTLALDMEVESELSRPMFMWVQFGARANLDSQIRWSTPAKVEVSGSGKVTTKVNTRAAGRFIRIRFYSEAIDAQWRIAGFTIIARKGGSY